MHPITELFGIQISTYSILLIIGVIAGLIISILRSKINALRKEEVFTCFLIAMVGALLGAKFFYMAQGFPEFLIRAQETGYTFWEYFSDAGVVYYGGFIGGVLFLLLAAKLFKIPIWGIIDTVLPSVPLMHAIGRIGCFMAGCCYGIPSEFGFYFNSSPFAPHGIQLLPVQLIESACLLGLFFFMLYFGRKKRTPGRILSIYLVFYGIIRFVLEFFRYDSFRGIYGAFSISQWVSIGMIVLGIFLWFWARKKKTENAAEVK